MPIARMKVGHDQFFVNVSLDSDELPSAENVRDGSFLADVVLI